MKFLKNKTIIITITILSIIWLLWILTHFLINFKLIGDTTIQINCGEEYKDMGAHASFLEKDLKVQSKNNIDIYKEGKYVVYYKTRNIFGIAKSLKRNVIVKNDKKPEIILKGENPIILGYNEKYVEPGYELINSGDEKIDDKIKITNNINIKRYGEYEVKYEYVDNNNNLKTIRKVIVKDKIEPIITLKGKIVLDVLLGQKYTEEGYSANDNIDEDITDKVEVIDNVNYNKLGSYEIIYKVKDSSDNEVIQKRRINVVEKLLEYKSEYDKIDNKQRGWWSKNKFDHKRPEGGANLEELKKYGAYFMGPDEKKIYLTYDEGQSDTYVPQIVEVLNKNNVKATFFLCRNYMLTNKDLIKKMVDNGHLIGNHTFHHYKMPTLANRENFDNYIYEIRAVEEAYREITGKEMKKVYREPKGEWSYRSLQIVKDLGYKTFFYSADYYDFKDDVPKDIALEKMLKRYHNGAIYLFHPKNKGNLEALDDFIKEMKKLGYSFDLVKNISY